MYYLRRGHQKRDTSEACTRYNLRTGSNTRTELIHSAEHKRQRRSIKRQGSFKLEQDQKRKQLYRIYQEKRQICKAYRNRQNYCNGKKSCIRKELQLQDRIQRKRQTYKQFTGNSSGNERQQKACCNSVCR